MKKLISTLTAAALLSAAFSAATCVSAEETSITITGEDNFLKSQNGEVVYTYYKALNNGVADNFKYELVEGTGVTVDENSGKITAKTAELGSSFTIKASLADDATSYQTKTVTVKDALNFDFESDETGFGSDKITTDSNGNNYLNASNSSRVTKGELGASVSGVGAVTLKYKMMITDSANTFNIASANEYNTDGKVINNGVWWMQMKFNALTGAITINDSKKNTQLGTFSTNEFIPVEMRFDFEKSSYDVYINDTFVKTLKCCTDSNVKDFKLSKLIVRTPIDDVEIFTGAETETTIESQYTNGLIPGEAGVECTNRFTLQGGSGDVTWSLANAVDGVSINNTTGVLSFNSSAQPGTVNVVATYGNNKTKEIGFELVKLGYFGTNDTTGLSGGTVATEGDETIITKNSNSNYIRYSISQNVASGRLVVTGKLRKITGAKNVGLGIAIHGQSDWAASSYSETADAWVDFRTIIDTERKTVTTLVDGEPYRAMVQDLTVSESNTSRDNISLSQIIMSGDLKSLSIYRAPENIAPKAYNVNVGSLAVGTPAQVSYDYFSESGLVEDCTQIEWLVSDTANGEYTSLGTGNTYTPTNADRSRFIKVKVTPAAGTLAGTTVESEPVMLGGGLVKSYSYADNKASVAARVANTLDNDMNAMIIIAEYSGGRLISLNVTPVEVAAGGVKEQNCELSGIVNDDVKVMIFDAENLRPLMDVYKPSK